MLNINNPSAAHHLPMQIRPAKMWNTKHACRNKVSGLSSKDDFLLRQNATGCMLERIVTDLKARHNYPNCSARAGSQQWKVNYLSAKGNYLCCVVM